MIRLHVFRCVPLSCDLTVASCGERHAKCMTTCRTCTVGAAHEAGEAPSTWSDGTPIARRDREYEARVATAAERAKPPVTLPRARRTFVMPPAGTTQRQQRAAPTRQEFVRYEYKGERLTAADLWRQPEAQRLKLSRNLVRERLKAGWAPERAVATPAGSPEARGRVFVSWGNRTMALSAVASEASVPVRELYYHVVEHGRTVDEAIERVRASRGAA